MLIIKCLCLDISDCFWLFYASKYIPTNVRPIYYRNAIQTLDSFGMVGFTEGVMYLMNTLFNVSNDALLCMPNKDIGDMLLADHVGKRQYG